MQIRLGGFGEYEMLLVKKNIKYDGLRKMIAELLNVDDNVRNMELKFETGHPFRPLYGVTDERTFEFYIHHARKDSTKYSLLVTLREDVLDMANAAMMPKKKLTIFWSLIFLVLNRYPRFKIW